MSFGQIFNGDYINSIIIFNFYIIYLIYFILYIYILL